MKKSIPLVKGMFALTKHTSYFTLDDKLEDDDGCKVYWLGKLSLKWWGDDFFWV